MSRFAGRVAIITGAGRGIGRAHAELLAAEGAKVVVNDVGCDTTGARLTEDHPAHEVADAIRAAGGDAVADEHDVVTDAPAIVRTALDTWGRVDLLVNNAGVGGSGEIDAMAPEVVRRIFDIHVVGAVAMLREVWPLFRGQGYGRVVNTASGAVFGAAGLWAYGSAKAAVVGLTRNLAIDGEEHNIRVNAVLPMAFTRLTDQIENDVMRNFMVERFPPDTLAPFVAALLDDDVPCNGEAFSIAGGIAARVMLATVAGYCPSTPTVDAYREHFAEILAGDPIIVGAATDEMALRAGQLMADAPVLTFEADAAS